jgi:hypothetical protein
MCNLTDLNYNTQDISLNYFSTLYLPPHCYVLTSFIRLNLLVFTDDILIRSNLQYLYSKITHVLINYYYYY